MLVGGRRRAGCWVIVPARQGSKAKPNSASSNMVGGGAGLGEEVKVRKAQGAVV